MKIKYFLPMLLTASFLFSCADQKKEENPITEVSTEFNYEVEQFADVKILRYQIPGFESLTLNQKKLVYYLSQAGMEGRDIIYDQNYRHNLTIKRALENIYQNYAGDKTTDDWKNFEIYLKRIWFSNGIHHHYSNDKFKPEFSKVYFDTLLKETNTNLTGEAYEVIFNDKDAKKVNLDETKGLLLGSATNYYGPDVTEKEAEKFYALKINKNDKMPVEFGLNSKLVKNANGSLEEKVWKVGGMYSVSIEKMVGWLEKAVEVAENTKQAEALKLLIDYYKTGDLKTWDAYNVVWATSTEGDIDY
ncbi:MAG: dihydrofolate reductase, partial [Lutibacter sp.]|nr:dihydrofolate reductase [Lutibacter sp.]